MPSPEVEVLEVSVGTGSVVVASGFSSDKIHTIHIPYVQQEEEK